MEIIQGISVASGIAIAPAVVLDAEEYRIPYRHVPPDQVDAELNLLSRALESSIVELNEQKNALAAQLGQDAADVFNWHIGVLQDASVRRSIEQLVRSRQHGAAYAASYVMRSHQRRFMQMSDPLLAERIRDVRDIERRLVRHILGESREDLAHLSREVVLVAHDLSASQTAQISGTRAVGVVLDVGGSTSHTAILLRSMGRPSVIGVKDVSTRVSGGDLVIVDGSHQIVIINPDEATLAHYRTEQQAYGRLLVELQSLRDLEPITRDAVRIRLNANIEFPGEARTAQEFGADGVGLYRTEFLFLRGEGEPTEEEQCRAYTAALEGMDGRPVTIRTFDLGADKYTQEKHYEQERNPMLGLRSIRYSLQNLDMFKTQLRAILRASVHGTVRLMFPLIISLMEYRQAKMTLHDAMEDLDDEGVPYDRNIPVGIMMETPAAALLCKELAREVGFMSVGTNDMIQYMLAVDRGNERVSRFFTPSHPAVLRVLRDVIRTCQRQGVDCSLCGEMAGEPLYTLLLLGMGLRDFSMAPRNIPEIKKLLRLVTIPQAERVARKALTFETERQVTNYLRDATKKVLPGTPSY